MAVKVIDFSASWCFPCKLQGPIIEKLKDKFKKVKFEDIDIDSDRTKSSKYNIRAVPTIIIEKEGKEVNRFVGVTAEKELEKALEKALK
jgi:thioredoxin 1